MKDKFYDDPCHLLPGMVLYETENPVTKHHMPSAFQEKQHPAFQGVGHKMTSQKFTCLSDYL